MKPACNVLKRCGSSKRPSSSPCSRIKEGISAEPPRNLAYTGIRYAERSESWKSTLVRHEQWGGLDHRDRSFPCRQCGDGQLKLSRFQLTATWWPDQIC